MEEKLGLVALGVIATTLCVCTWKCCKRLCSKGSSDRRQLRIHQDDIDDLGMPPQIVGHHEEESGAETVETDEDLHLVEQFEIPTSAPQAMFRSPLPSGTSRITAPRARGSTGPQKKSGLRDSPRIAIRSEELADLLG